MTIEEAIQSYITDRSVDSPKNSLANYKRILGRMGAYLGLKNEVSKITNADISEYQSKLGDSGLAQNTRVLHGSVIRTFFKFLGDRGESKVRYLAIRSPKKLMTRPNVITSAQFRKIDAHFSDQNYAQLIRKLIFNLLWDTGMRISELLALDIVDIDSQKNYTAIRTKKNGDFRIVVWSERTHNLLLKYLGIRICLNQRPELFHTPTGRGGRRTRLTSRAVQRWCKKLGANLGFPINPHAFRHGKMHEILNKGGNRHHVKTIAGHAGIASSEIYVKMNEKEQLRIQRQFLGDGARIPEELSASPYQYRSAA